MPQQQDRESLYLIWTVRIINDFVSLRVSASDLPKMLPEKERYRQRCHLRNVLFLWQFMSQRGSVSLQADVFSGVNGRALGCPGCDLRVCCVALHLHIPSFRKRRWRSGSHLPLRSVGSDREALIEDTCYGSNHTRKRSRKCKDAFMANNNLPKRSDMGHYMDVTVQPVRKVCLKEVKISREGQSQNEKLKRTVKVVRVDETCSVSSSDFSTFNSDLEWDFEEAASLQGCKVSVKQQDWAEAFPLEQWTGTPATASSFSTRPAPAPGTPTPCCCELNTATASHMPGEVDGKTEAILEK
ncbi:transmembrane protein 44 isoform X3 [Engraulis encrasicolus]|uniref:transmembrane protein 44 isoform X3 n=1 Tax=Engraulis encrasicolus TaxID=184585 RepID=UPI002FD444E7